MDKIKKIITCYTLKQYVLYIMGIALMPLGVVLTLKSELGAGGYDSLNFAIAEILRINVSVAIWITAVVVLFITAVIRHSMVRVTTFISSFLLGISTDIWKIVLEKITGTNFIESICLLLIGIFIIAVAVAAYVISGFPCNPTDDLVVALHERGIPLGCAKLGFDIICVCLSYVAGGTIGIGTVLCTIFLGPCIQIISRVLNKCIK